MDDTIKRRLTKIASSKPLAAAHAPAINIRHRRNARELPRERSFQFANLNIGLATSIAGVLINQNSKGGLLKFNGSTALPDSLAIEIPALGIRRHVEIVWQIDSLAGFKYI